MLLRDFLETRTLGPQDPSYMPIDPKVHFAYVLNREGKPERHMSQSRILVPLVIWDLERENDLLAALLNHAAGGKTHRAQNVAALNPQLWAKLTHNLNCLVMHPDLRGRFELPRLSTAFYSENVPLNRILCLGQPNRVGTYLIKDTLRGVFVPAGHGVQAVSLFDAQSV